LGPRGVELFARFVEDGRKYPRVSPEVAGLGTFLAVLGFLLAFTRGVWGYQWTHHWVQNVLFAGASGVIVAVIAGSPRVRQLLTRRPGGVDAWRYLVVGVYVSILVIRISPLVENQGVGSALILALGGAPFVIYVSGFWRWWNVFDPPKDEHRLAVAIAVFGGLTMLTLVFAVGTAALGVQGWLQESGFHARSGLDLGEDLTVGSLSAYYVWHLVEAIPAVEIPKTLNWEVPYTFKDSLSGALMLIYKLLVILPIVAILKQFFSPEQEQEQSGQHLPTYNRGFD
jgi:hypothetical protein